MTGERPGSGVEAAARHALGWLAFGCLAGMWLSILLLAPSLPVGEWTYGRWVPAHLNTQLYGWTSLPLVGWLFAIYQVDGSRAGRWSVAAVRAWSVALAAGTLHWIAGNTSGKIFLDWKGGALAAFLAAQAFLWIVLFLAWRERSPAWSVVKRRCSLAGLAALALVPLSLGFAASPDVYPPVDRTTGGPTGSSLLGSTLVVVGLLGILPRVAGLERRRPASRFAPAWFAAGWVVFGITEAVGGTHFDWWQLLAMAMLLPWVWLLPAEWTACVWPAECRPWRRSMFFWWGLLVLSGLLAYAPGVLDRIKFTQGLVAHSHLAMAGFTTSFCAHLLVWLTGRRLGGTAAVVAWNAAAFGMVVVLASAGWREGAGYSWMVESPWWRSAAFAARAGCGGLMAVLAVVWWNSWNRNR